MNLDKNQIDAVRYQLKKLGIQETIPATEIREEANKINSDDALLIAQGIAANKSVGLATVSQGNQEPEAGLATVTQKQKETMIRKEAKSLGIVLDPKDIKQIALDIKVSYDSQQKTLNNAKELILAFLAHTQNQLALAKNQTREEIAQAVEQFNEVLSQQNQDTNEFFNTLAENQKKLYNENQQTLDGWLASIQEAFTIPSV